MLMEGRGFGFVTYRDPQNAQQFLEVQPLSYLSRSVLPCGCACVQVCPTSASTSDAPWCGLQQREHVIDGKKVEAKAAVPKNSGNSPTLTRKMFVGGTVSRERA